ncbi:peptidoglycan-binding protein, partial [Escherichia coli]|uniref:peptidoglycan-binding protein n=1 Tax=Escherichia coli TaxID=562 RepID=UPI003C77DBA7
ALLRKRLGVPVQAVEGVTYAAEFYDGALAAVVKSFQREKGLSANGTVGRATRRELNEGMQKADPDSIVANME